MIYVLVVLVARIWGGACDRILLGAIEADDSKCRRKRDRRRKSMSKYVEVLKQARELTPEEKLKPIDDLISVAGVIFYYQFSLTVSFIFPPAPCQNSKSDSV